MYARPKPGETQEDLLLLQAEFEKNKLENRIQPAATVISVNTKSKSLYYPNNVGFKITLF